MTTVGAMLLAIGIFALGGMVGASVLHAWWVAYYMEKLQGWQKQVKEIRETLERKERAWAQHPPEPEPGAHFVIVRKKDWAQLN